MMKRSAIYAGVVMALGSSGAMGAENSANPLSPIQEAIARAKKGSDEVRKTLKLGDIEIVLIERARYASGIESSIGTDSIVETRKAGKTVAKAEFKGLDAVGGYTGLQLPQAQPLRDYVLVKKLGNYDTRLLVVDNKGKIFDLPFGTTYLGKSEEFLFAIRTTTGETPEYAILNLKDRKVAGQARDDAKAAEFNRASRIFREGIVYQVFWNSGAYFAVATEKDAVKPDQARELAASSMVKLDHSGAATLATRDPALSSGAEALKEIPARGIGWVTIR